MDSDRPDSLHNISDLLCGFRSTLDKLIANLEVVKQRDDTDEEPDEGDPTWCGSSCRHDAWSCGRHNLLKTYRESLELLARDIKATADIMQLWETQAEEEAKVTKGLIKEGLADIKMWNGEDDAMSTSSVVSETMPIEPIDGLLKMPVEILIHIFLWATRMDRNAPLICSHLNSCFRDLVLNTPELWAFVNLVTGLPRVEVHLIRSKNAPLHIRAALLPLVPVSEGMQQIQSFKELLIPHVGRILDIDVDFEYGEWTGAMYSLFETPGWSEILEFLGVKIGDSARGEDTIGPTLNSTYFQCHARRLHFTCVSFGRSLSFFGPHVVDFTLEYSRTDTFEAFYSALQRMSCLQRLEIRDAYFRDERDWIHRSDTPKIELEHLDALELARVSISSQRALLGIITTPNLKHFSINHGHVLLSCGVIPFAQANTQLLTLEIYNCELDHQSWWSAARSLPLLKKLRLCATLAKAAHLRILVNTNLTDEGTVQPGAPVNEYACPNLEELVLDNEIELTSDIVKDIVACRATGDGIRLRSVVMRGWDSDNVKRDDVETIQEMVEHFVLEVFDKRVGMINAEEYDEEYEYSVDGDTEDWEMASGDFKI